MSLFHQRRFAKLGYSAALTIAALDLLQMLLHETEGDNLLIQSGKLYIECEFFSTKLQDLSYFTHKVTLPLFNCVEISSQNDLLQILPTLYHGLADGSMHTQDKYHVSYKQLPVAEPESKLAKENLYLMCVDAIYALKLQCGRQMILSCQEQHSWTS